MTADNTRDYAAGAEHESTHLQAVHDSHAVNRTGHRRLGNPLGFPSLPGLIRRFVAGGSCMMGAGLSALLLAFLAGAPDVLYAQSSPTLHGVALQWHAKKESPGRLDARKIVDGVLRRNRTLDISSPSTGFGQISSVDPNSTYIEGTLGTHASNGLHAGFSRNSGSVAIYADTRMSHSNGTGSLDPLSSYRADGGISLPLGSGERQNTSAQLDASATYQNQSWSLGDASPDSKRSIRTVSADSRATIVAEEFLVQAGGEVMLTDLTGPEVEQGITNRHDNTFKGRVDALWKRGAVKIGARTEAFAGSSSGAHRHVSEASLFGSYRNAFVALKAGAAVHSFATDPGIGRSTLVTPDLRLTLTPLPHFSVSGSVNGNVEEYSLARIVRNNPFARIEPGSGIDVQPRAYGISAQAANNDNWSIRLSAETKRYDRMLMYRSLGNGSYSANYVSADLDVKSIDFYGYPTRRIGIAGLARHTSGSTGGNAPLLHVPEIEAELYVHRTLSNVPVTVSLGVHYIGERNTGMRTLRPVWLTNFTWSYSFRGIVDFVLEARNLTNQSWTAWEGHPERGLHVSGGMRTRF